MSPTIFFQMIFVYHFHRIPKIFLYKIFYFGIYLKLFKLYLKLFKLFSVEWIFFVSNKNKTHSLHKLAHMCVGFERNIHTVGDINKDFTTNILNKWILFFVSNQILLIRLLRLLYRSQA